MLESISGNQTQLDSLTHHSISTGCFNTQSRRSGIEFSKFKFSELEVLYNRNWFKSLLLSHLSWRKSIHRLIYNETRLGNSQKIDA